MTEWVYASDLRIYEFCPRRLYLKRVKNVSKAQEGNKRECLLRKNLYLRIPDLLQRHYEENIPIKQLIEERDMDLSSFISFLKFLARQDINEVIDNFYFHEKYVFLSSKKLGLKGRLDAYKLQGNEAIPYLLRCRKTRRRPFFDERLQLMAYSLLLKQQGFEVTCGFIVYLLDCDSRPLALDNDLGKKTLDRIKKIKRLYSSSLPRICPHGSTRKCMNCSFQDTCYLL